jgi:hypothetical protein
MNCADWEERIALHAGEDLKREEAAEVERHLADCPGCQVFWSGMRQTLAELQEVHSEGMRAADLAAVRAGVMAEIERGRRLWRRLAWVSGVGIAAALMLAVALRPAPLPDPPRTLALRIPQAPLVRTVARAVPEPVRKPATVKTASAVPVVVKWQTADPNIVIYWIGEN